MRVRHSSRAMPGSVADSESPAPVTILLSPRARVLLLAVIARGDDGFIITSRKGDVAVRARLVRTATVDIDYGCLSIDWCSGTVSSSIGRVMLSRTELRLLGVLLAGGERAVAYEHLLE